MLFASSFNSSTSDKRCRYSEINDSESIASWAYVGIQIKKIMLKNYPFFAFFLDSCSR